MRRRRERYKPAKDWRDPDMPVTRSWFDPGAGCKITEELTPEASSELSTEAMDGPDYRIDPSYHWAREVRAKRRNQK